MKRSWNYEWAAQLQRRRLNNECSRPCFHFASSSIKSWYVSFWSANQSSCPIQNSHPKSSSGTVTEIVIRKSNRQQASETVIRNTHLNQLFGIKRWIYNSPLLLEWIIFIEIRVFRNLYKIFRKKDWKKKWFYDDDVLGHIKEVTSTSESLVKLLSIYNLITRVIEQWKNESEKWNVKMSGVFLFLVNLH